MRPTRVRFLLLVLLCAGAAAFVLADRFYASAPPLPPYAPGTVFVLAVAEGYSAYVVRARLRWGNRPPGRRIAPIHPIAVARIAALAKASSLVGALVAGGYGGLVGYLVARLHAIPVHDTEVAVAGALSGTLLALAALLLEQVCRIPGPPHDRDADDQQQRTRAERR
jgi:hypothetical protein